MESEYGCWLNYGNAGQLQSTWLQSKLSDLEENTKSMLSLIKLENGDSFAERAETYYQKKPELEKRIAKYQQLYRLLLDHYSPILARSSVSSISTVSNFENNYLRNSLKIESSNSNPESCVEDLDQGMQEKIMPKWREISPKKLEIEMSNLKLNTELCEKNISSPKIGSFNSNTESFIEGIYLETQEKNIPKIGEIGQKIISKSNGISPKKINGNIFERLVDFEKRMSCSEELVEDNKRHVDELTRRYEETHKLNKMLAEQLSVRMKDIEFLHNENLRLLSEKRLKKEKKRAKFWRKISIKRLKGLVKRKGSIKWLKGLVKSACLWRK